MKPCWINDLVDLKERIFVKYNIKPIYSCLECPYYDEIKGHEICMKSENGEIHKCSDAKKIYPEITDEIIFNLIILLSNYKKVEFYFERNKNDIILNILNDLLQMKEDKEFKKGVKHVFGR